MARNGTKHDMRLLPETHIFNEILHLLLANRFFFTLVLMKFRKLYGHARVINKQKFAPHLD